MTPEEELKRLQNVSSEQQLIPGIGGVQFDVRAVGASDVTLQLAKHVLSTLLTFSSADWRTPEGIAKHLPEKFVGWFSPPRNQAEVEEWLRRWRAASNEERQRLEDERRWELLDWLWWMEPSQRSWYWWGATVDTDDSFRVVLSVNQWPFPWRSFKCLMLASGATAVEPES